MRKAANSHTLAAQTRVKRGCGVKDEGEAALWKSGFEVADFFRNMHQSLGLVKRENPQADGFVRRTLLEFEQAVKGCGVG